MPIELHWLRPQALYLLPLVLVLPYVLRHLTARAAGWQQLIAAHLLQALALGQKQQQPRWRVGFALWLLVAVLALAGPSWQQLPQPAFNLKRGTVLLMDMSLSMHATDVKPDRLSLARYKAIDFATLQAEGDMALVSFAGDAFVISPLTPDHQNITMMVPMLKPEIMPVQGSDLLSALKMADKLLQQAGYPRGDVVAFTDGFSQEQATVLREYIDEYPHRLSVIAFGTLDGAPIKLEQGNLLKDRQGSIVLPKVPLQQLRQLAEVTGGTFQQARFDNSDIQHVAEQQPLSQDHNQQADSRFQGEQWQDGGLWLVWLLLPLLWMWIQRAPWLVLVAITCLPATLPPVDAHEATQGTAAPAAEPTWQDLTRRWLWNTPQETAREWYDAANFDEAKQHFDEPLWQGNAAYRQGDYKGAEQLYRQAGGAAGLFNAGNALAKQQNYQGALQAYTQAAKLQGDLPGVAQNIELMKQLLQAQQQQSSDQQSQQSNERDPNNQPNNQQNNQQSEQNNSDSAQQQQADASKQQGQSTDDSGQAGEQQQQDATQQRQQQSKQQAMQQAKDKSPTEQQVDAVSEAWPNATPEQSQQLDAILRKVQDDPYQLLHNKMMIEYQRRNAQAPQHGDDEEW